MRIALIVIILLTFYSCNNAKGGIGSEDINYGKTPLESIKEEYINDLNDLNYRDARGYFVRKHQSELLKTLEIVEEVEVEKDVVLIFYRYSIGADIVKKTTYMRKIDGLYVPYYKYYSDYDEDPFKNGKAEEAKKLLKKAEDWSDSNENIWWAL